MDSIIVDALTSGFNGLKDDIFAITVVVLPVSLGVMGLFWASKRGIGFFKSTAK